MKHEHRKDKYTRNIVKCTTCVSEHLITSKTLERYIGCERRCKVIGIIRPHDQSFELQHVAIWEGPHCWVQAGPNRRFVRTEKEAYEALEIWGEYFLNEEIGPFK